MGAVKSTPSILVTLKPSKEYINILASPFSIGKEEAIFGSLAEEEGDMPK